MSKIFRPLILNKNAVTYLDEVFMQSQTKTKDEMFIVLGKYHQTLLQENMKAAPDKSNFFLTQVKFFGHIIERNTITPLKSRIDAIQKLQPPSNKNKNTKISRNVKLLKQILIQNAVILKTILQQP